MTLKPDYDFLSTVTAVIGLVTAFLGLPTLIAPARAGQFWRSFHRRVWPGRLLTVVCIIWSALWLCLMPLGPLMVLQGYLWLLIPISIAAVWFFTPELLSCRAVGGLFILVPTPMLSAAAWHPSPFRYVVIVYAYAIVLAGMLYVALPWLLRDHIGWVFAKANRTYAIAAMAVAFGLFLVILSATVFPAVKG